MLLAECRVKSRPLHSHTGLRKCRWVDASITHLRFAAVHGCRELEARIMGGNWSKFGASRLSATLFI